MLLPGRRTIRDALGDSGRRAAMVVAGSVVLFGIAGVIEGVFRQVVQDDSLRFALAGFNAIWFFGWLLLGGRKRSGADEDPA